LIVPEIRTFWPSKVSENRVIAKFRVLDETGSVVGSISVPRNQADDLIRSWAGPTDQSATRGVARAAAKRGPVAELTEKSIAAGKSRGGKMTRAVVLRGS
jgi:hypothetical protein